MQNDQQLISDILKYADYDKLAQFIRDIAQDNDDFRRKFIETFSPLPDQSNNEAKEDYDMIIRTAFNNNANISYDIYRGHDFYGFIAEDVRADLELLLEKAQHFIRYDNYDEALCIAKKLIEIIPEERDEQFDYEGDVQVVYDEAIELIRNLLEDNLLTGIQKRKLFDWYEKEIQDTKHQYVGLNTNLRVLENLLIKDVENGIDRMIAVLDRKIQQESGYRQEDAVADKLKLLQENGRNTEAEETLEKYLHLPKIREIKLDQLIYNRQYAESISLINEGIKIASDQMHFGVVSHWKKRLLSIYKLQNDSKNILKLLKEFFEDQPSKNYYNDLRAIIPKEDWNDTLGWILKTITRKGYYGFNTLLADIYIEHEMWTDLWQLCRRFGADAISEYEKHLRPHYEKEILAAYQNFVQKQSQYADNDSYANVATFLKRMKTFDGGKAVVDKLIAEYREKYKRRTNFMKALDGV